MEATVTELRRHCCWYTLSQSSLMEGEPGGGEKNTLSQSSLKGEPDCGGQGDGEGYYLLGCGALETQQAVGPLHHPRPPAVGTEPGGGKVGDDAVRVFLLFLLLLLLLLPLHGLRKAVQEALVEATLLHLQAQEGSLMCLTDLKNNINKRKLPKLLPFLNTITTTTTTHLRHTFQELRRLPQQVPEGGDGADGDTAGVACHNHRRLRPPAELRRVASGWPTHHAGLLSARGTNVLPKGRVPGVVVGLIWELPKLLLSERRQLPDGQAAGGVQGGQVTAGRGHAELEDAVVVRRRPARHDMLPHPYAGRQVLLLINSGHLSCRNKSMEIFIDVKKGKATLGS
ncbi:hypothetical protein E2C01_014258 [Portunus trituberculatus]|uniref:Uncharacterized protein n=1 Tax=Portunus trituberculatus TaxID=210409 RepID=A0A5B7DJY3_PORTR|nr:hypothetical protein [Portunus trituberculatus]